MTVINPNRHPVLVGIDAEVLAELMRRARPFLDEPNDVLRAVLGLGARRDDAQAPATRARQDADAETAATRRRPGARHAAAAGRAAAAARSTTPPRATPPSRATTPPRAPKGSLTREEAFEIPLLEALERAGGELPARAALAAVGAAMAGVLNEEDRFEDDQGVARWQKRVPFVRLKLVERGLMRRDSARGVWAISDAGRRRLARARG